MPSLLILAAATGLTVPSLIQSVSPDDYPTWAVKRDLSGGGVVHVAIDPKGKVIECSLLSEIGDSKLAGSICSVVARKRYRPGTLRNGEKVHAVFDSMINFWLPDTAEGRKIGAMRQSADAEMTVNQLPVGELAEATVFLAYDASGMTTDCVPTADAKSQTLAKVVCDQRTIFDNLPQKDKAGQAVPYVTRKIVRFSVAPQQ